jgi:alkylation response protein AidB-like acyl-CoA dehydrogenase
MADEEQKKYFFDFIEQTHCTTFTGITEPQHGSDVASLETQLIKVDSNNYQLTGEKCFITHGFDGKIGVVVARIGSGPLGIQAVMLKEEDLEHGVQEGTLQRELLPIVGMRGTCLSRMIFNKFSVSVNNLLGKHLRVSQRGMFSLIKTFNRMRPCVAAFALGQAQAMLDYVKIAMLDSSSSTEALLRVLNAELACARGSLYESAKIMDENPLESASVSLVKAHITRLTEHVTLQLINHIGAAALCEHSLFLKWSRDIYAFEYMEGTSDMQKRNVSQEYLMRVKAVRL